MAGQSAWYAAALPCWAWRRRCVYCSLARLDGPSGEQLSYRADISSAESVMENISTIVVILLVAGVVVAVVACSGHRRWHWVNTVTVRCFCLPMRDEGRRASSPVSSQFVPSRLRPERTAQNQSRSPHPRRQIDSRRKIPSRREAKLIRRKIRSQLNSPASISLRWRVSREATIVRPHRHCLRVAY